MNTQLETAVYLAAQLHLDQVRKYSGLPYVVHPIEVMKRLGDMWVRDRVTLIAAVLHDVIEDSPREQRGKIREHIRDTYGDAVLQVVEELTFYPRKVKTKEAYIASFADKSPMAVAIKMVDRGCNILDFRSSGQDKKADEYAQEGLLLHQLFTKNLLAQVRLRQCYGGLAVSRMIRFAQHVWRLP